VTQRHSLNFLFQSRLLAKMNFLRSLMIVLLNALPNRWRQGCKQLKPYSESSTCRKTDRTIGVRIRDHYRGWSAGDTKSMDDMVFDEVDNISGFNFNKQCSFCPLCEVIGYHKDEPMTSCWWRNDGSYKIDSLRFEWPWSDVGWSSFRGYCMKSVWIWQSFNHAYSTVFTIIVDQ